MIIIGVMQGLSSSLPLQTGLSTIMKASRFYGPPPKKKCKTALLVRQKIVWNKINVPSEKILQAQFYDERYRKST